jgi:hypothetical protein
MKVTEEPVIEQTVDADVSTDNVTELADAPPIADTE